MIRFKKTIGILLSVLLVFGCVTTAFAAPAAYEKGTATLKLEAPAGSIANGENGTVAVKVTTDFNVANMSLPVFYKETAGVTVTAAAEANFNVTTEAEAVNKTDVYTGAGLNADGTDSQGAKYNFFLITFIGKVGAQAEQFADKLACNITVTNAGDFKGALEFKTFAASKKTVENTRGLLFIGKSTGATIEHAKPVDCADGLVATGTVNFGTAANPVLKGKAATFNSQEGLGIVDEEKKFVYGIVPGANVEDFFTVENGTFEVVAGLKADGTNPTAANGTGAKLKVKNNTDEVVAEYTVVIFGDVDSDGVISATDQTNVGSYTLGITTAISNDKASSFILAADVDHDGVVSATDQTNVGSYTISITNAIKLPTGTVPAIA